MGTTINTLKMQSPLNISNSILPSIIYIPFSNTASKFLLASCVAALGANALPAQSSARSSEIIADISASPPKTPVTQTDNWKQFGDVTISNPTAPTQEVGTYKQFTYNSFSLSQQLLEGQGLNPQSRPNVAVFSVVGDLTGGGVHTITAEDGGAFDLKELYFDCTLLTVQSAAAVPSACTMVFNGYGEDDGVVSQRSSSFGGGSEVNKVDFDDDFSKVYRVDFSIDELLDQVLADGVVDS